MADQNERRLQDLLQLNNAECADCRTRHNIEYASYNIGIFLCTRCASVHRSIGAHLSKVKHLKLDKWEDSQVERIKEVGNSLANEKFERTVPQCYLRPNEFSNQVLVEQWIRAKYERLEFSVNERPLYTNGYMEGFLMKRGKEDVRYHPRKFVLADDTLRYYVKEHREPKAIISISGLNVVFAPPKIEHPYSLQFSYIREGSTRHIYVYHDSPEIIINWFMAIRCAKLHQLQITFPMASDSELLDDLTWDFAKEGWLQKTGPRLSDSYKRRWFSLENRKLMYHDDPLDAYPKGEIFLGHISDGYTINVGAPEGAKDQGFSFTLTTPERIFNLSSSSKEHRDEWIYHIRHVIQRPMTLQDSSVCAKLIRKRTGNIFGGK